MVLCGLCFEQAEGDEQCDRNQVGYECAAEGFDEVIGPQEGDVLADGDIEYGHREEEQSEDEEDLED